MKARLGAALMLVLLAAAGCSDKSTSPPPVDHTVTRVIDDLNYVRGQYFFIQLPAQQSATAAVVDLATLRVFVDDLSGTNNQNVRSGYGEIDPNAPPNDAWRIPGAFDELQGLVDYELSVQLYGDQFPVLILKHPLSPYEMLGVTYVEVLPGAVRREVGSVPVCSGAGCDSIHVKLLQVPRDLLVADALDPDFYESDLGTAPLNVVRGYELKSVYDIGFRNVAPGDLAISVRRYSAGLDESNDAVNDQGQIISYLQILGIDLFKDNGAGVATPGADQDVDRFPFASFLDLDRGILFFPDLRPFDPRIDGRADAQPVEDLFFRPRMPNVDQSIPGLRRRVLWPRGLANPPGSTQPTTPVSLETNPNVYDKRNILATVDRRYYLQVKGPESAAP